LCGIFKVKTLETKNECCGKHWLSCEKPKNSYSVQWLTKVFWLVDQTTSGLRGSTGLIKIINFTSIYLPLTVGHYIVQLFKST